jgi:hypothetical protein
MERESCPLGLGNPGKRSYFECMKAISTAFPWPISPAESLRRFVRYGLLSAFVFAMAADARLFDSLERVPRRLQLRLQSGF